MANKSVREELHEIGQLWCFHIKYRTNRTRWYDLLARFIRKVEKRP